MPRQGHRVEHDFADGDALIHALIAAGGHDPEFLSDTHLEAAQARLPLAEYVRWFDALPWQLRKAVTDTWGPPPGEHYVDGDDFVIAGLALGNVFLAIQPPRGYGENPVAIYHDPNLAPAHHYLATYVWFDQKFGADAIVHLGKHGTLEWLPGKALGLSAACAPDACLGDVPFFYPFVVNDPGEGMQAKRRAHAVVIDHLVPPMMRAETYDELAQLEQLLDEYARCEALDPAKLPILANRIWTLLHEADLHSDLDVTGDQPALEDFGALIEHVDGYLCEIKDLQVRDGLHILGRVPEGDQFRGLLGACLRIPGLRAAIGIDDVDAAAAEEERLLRAFLETGDVGDDPGVRPLLELARDEIVPKLRATPNELTALIGGLHGRHVPAGPSGSPTRGRLDVLPTGRNMYSVDPRALPSELAYETGVRLADALLADGVPETVGIVVWGTAAMRTAGDDAGEILALLGVRPRWHAETRRIARLEVISLEELGRPRVDVTVRISGFFRDAFPHLVELLDEAVCLVAGLDEPIEQNYVRKHVLADVEGLAGDWRGATARIFGGRPGTYGTGILQLVDVRNWRDDADLAEVYEAWGGHAYGRGLDGAEARSAMRRQFARIDVAVKNIDTREHDLLDSSDYFAEHGGMIAYVRHLAGADPRAVIGDSSDPAAPAARSLAAEAQARVPLPRRQPALDRLDDAPRLQGRLRALRDRRLPLRLRRHHRRGRGLDVRVGHRALRRRRRGARLPAPLEPVGAARDRRTPPRGRRPRPLGDPVARVARDPARGLPRGRRRARGGEHVTAPVGVVSSDAGVSPPGGAPVAFPFSAIVGQEDLREALLACAVDPAIGGVLVRGERGTAKTTAVRGLAPLVGSLVELPIGATADRVLGTLDLDRALGEGEAVFKPGLLASADRRPALRGRGQPAARPPRRRAARRGRARAGPRRARRVVGRL